MLLPELQRLAQSMGITGVGRMRKSQLIEVIQSRQGGQAAAVCSGTGGAVLDNSAKRGAPAGAGAPRHREQDAMEPDRPSQAGPGEGTPGRHVRRGFACRQPGPGRLRASAGASQLAFGQAETGQADRASEPLRRAAAADGAAGAAGRARAAR